MSSGTAIFERYRERAGIRVTCAAIYIVTSAIYLSWRTTILNPEAPILSGAFLLAECIAFLLGLLTIWLSSSYKARADKPARAGLNVDVFVTAYKEPAALIEKTLQAAIDVTYPHETWLLDDGNRDELRDLARRFGCRYLARDKNIGAKAGNLNNGMAHSRAEFVAVFDADHIPLPGALDLLLGHFDDPEVSFVQAPQDFYNSDCFQFENSEGGRRLWHDQSYFYAISMGCRDSFNAATCVGTGVVYRRSALDQIGGIPSETVTEDLHTSLKLHKAGYKSVFVSDPVAYGVGAADLREYYKTRLRWGHGNVHALRHENILFCKGLTFAQRISYLTLGLIYLEGWQNLILYLVPIMALLTGYAPFEISLLSVLLITGFPVFTYLLMQEFACGYGRYWVNELFGMIRFPVYIAATFAAFRNQLAWRSSSKQLSGDVEWRLMTPQLAILALSVLAICIAGYQLLNNPQAVRGAITNNLIEAFSIWSAQNNFSFIAWFKSIGWTDAQAGGYSLDLFLLAGFWVLVNILRSLTFTAKVLKSARGAKDRYFFKIPFAAHIGSGSTRALASVCQVSEDELYLVPPPAPLPAGEAHMLTIYSPEGPFNSSVKIDYGKTAPGLNGETGCLANIRWQNRDHKAGFSKLLYQCTWYRALFTESGGFRTPLQSFARLFKKVRPRGFEDVRDVRNWAPAIATSLDGSGAIYPVYIDADKFDSTRQMIASFDNCLPEGPFSLQSVANRSLQSRTIEVEKVQESNLVGLTMPAKLSIYVGRPADIVAKAIEPDTRSRA